MLHPPAALPHQRGSCRRSCWGAATMCLGLRLRRGGPSPAALQGKLVGRRLPLVRAPSEVHFLHGAILASARSTQDRRGGRRSASRQCGTRCTVAGARSAMELLQHLLLLLLRFARSSANCCELKERGLLGTFLDGGFGEALVCGDRGGGF